MFDSETFNYNRISKAVNFIHKNSNEQPALEVVADKVHMSPFHFQRLFKKWTGVSPKKFTRYLTPEYIKGQLEEQKLNHEETLSSASSTTGRQHDLFINIDKLSTGDLKDNGNILTIYYSYFNSKFGKVMVASTDRGICSVQFVSDEYTGYLSLVSQFTNARFQMFASEEHSKVRDFMDGQCNENTDITLCLSGTEFQLMVWEALLKIPEGDLTTYGILADQLGRSSAARAVGSAVACNPIAYLIPCHRVIRSTGEFGEYRWGKKRKKVMLGMEAVHKSSVVMA